MENISFVHLLFRSHKMLFVIPTIKYNMSPKDTMPHNFGHNLQRRKSTPGNIDYRRQPTRRAFFQLELDFKMEKSTKKASTFTLPTHQA